MSLNIYNLMFVIAVAGILAASAIMIFKIFSKTITSETMKRGREDIRRVIRSACSEA
jgi:Tfp pilus assembly protein FimT